MRVLAKRYQVKPNQEGYLYRNNAFEQKMKPGFHKVWDWNDRSELFCLPTTTKLITITNQEVLTKDNVALRFSFNVLYKIVDGMKLLGNFSLDRPMAFLVAELEQRIYNVVQIAIRNRISEYESESLNEKHHEVAEFGTEEMNKELEALGIVIEQAQLKDLTFPKTVQDLFAKHLEAKIRAKSDLENARTAVATARALKNASELMKDDDNIKFFQIMETITKIADKGKHTFMIGDMNQLMKRG
jgi:regulator of protease activity HflC (stomatin/prohibitin superfamily)